MSLDSQPGHFIGATKNRRMLCLQDIVPLDKLPKTWAIHLESVPLHYYPLLAVWWSDLAALKKVMFYFA